MLGPNVDVRKRDVLGATQTLRRRKRRFLLGLNVDVRKETFLCYSNIEEKEETFFARSKR